MIDEVRLEVTGNVQLFGGEVTLPKGTTAPGAIEFYDICPNGIEQRVRHSALIRLDRALLERLGATLVPNRDVFDFGVLEYVERGDIQIRP